MKFNSQRNGYDQREVDNYIETLLLLTDKQVDQIKEKLSKVIEENDNLKKELNKAREAKVSSITNSSELKEELLKLLDEEKEIVNPRNDELISFIAKVDSLLNKNQIKKTQNVFDDDKYSRLIKKYENAILGKETSDNNKQDETREVIIPKNQIKKSVIKPREPIVIPSDDMKKDVSKKPTHDKKVYESAIDMDEALNPTQSLEEICDDLGLIDKNKNLKEEKTIMATKKVAKKPAKKAPAKKVAKKPVKKAAKKPAKKAPAKKAPAKKAAKKPVKKAAKKPAKKASKK